jgi:glucuronate isomerase
MRWMGIDEKLITGDADPFDKFKAWAYTVENIYGNPIYHWTHLELRRYFNINEVLTSKSARDIYTRANLVLQNTYSLKASNIFKKFDVRFLCTADDPTSNLINHKRICDDKEFSCKVIPTFRVDRFLDILDDNWMEAIKELETASNVTIFDCNSLFQALENRLNEFVKMGCVSSDCSTSSFPSIYPKMEEVNLIIEKRIKGLAIEKLEEEAYIGYLLLNLAKLYNKKKIVMAIHLSCIRRNNPWMIEKSGIPIGYDCSDDQLIALNLICFFKKLSLTDEIPKTILFSLNPKDYHTLVSIIGCFQGNGIKGKIQLGPAWWFNDHIDGIEYQMEVLSNLGVFSTFISMLTDSKSFLSFPRHEYFRRIVCNKLGNWMETGRVPNDMDRLITITKNVFYNNAKESTINNYD